jgi:branched-chain amino acid transport system permease protein
MSLYLVSVLTNITLLSFLAISAYLILIVGEVSFGQQAFFGIGAYLAAMSTSMFGSSLITGLLIGSFIGSAVAVLLACITVRLSGIYFSIATLAFAELFRLAMLQVRLKDFHGEGTMGPDGPEGMEGIRWVFENDISAQTFLFASLSVLIVVIIALSYAEKSRLFISARIVGEDPIAAQALGIRPAQCRLIMIALSGWLAAFSGGLFAHHSTYIDPSMFGIMLGVHSLAYAVIGGLGTPIGPILGALIDVGILEGIRAIASYRMIVFGGLIAILLIFFPRGILSPRTVFRFRRWWTKRHA